MARRNLYIPDDLYERIRRAAAEEGARRGQPMSVSEWLREAAEEKIERQRQREAA